MKIYNIPFHIGASDTNSNPDGVPNLLDFDLTEDKSMALLHQELGNSVLEALEKSYCFGKLIGTPLSESEDAKPYADDFLELILDQSPGKNVLEIGCGKGYLLKRLQEDSYVCTGIEPGEGYSSSWNNYEVNVINDFFPSTKDNKNYDLIYGYMLLEHINNPLAFIKNLLSRLNTNGMAIFAVPDCTDEIINSDPAMLIHEHISYFDKYSLANLFKLAGMTPKIFTSNYGRSLYVVASRSSSNDESESLHLDSFNTSNYLKNVRNNIIKSKDIINASLQKGSTGIYCPSRALNILDENINVRFFDDDPYLYNKYLPPFQNPIENFSDCIKRPPENIVLASRTFNSKIYKKLINGGFDGNIINLFESD